MAITMLLLVALAVLWLHAPKPQPIKVRRNLLREELLDSYESRRD